MKKIVTLVVLLALGYASSIWAADMSEKSGEQEGYARIRFFGQAVIGLTYYENKACYGGDGEYVSTTGFGGVFHSKKNISIGMPVTPNVTNLKNRDGILSRAFYHEYYVRAAEPITISAEHVETTGRTGYHCDPINASFVPENKKDYEVALDVSLGQSCSLNVTQIDSTEEAVKLVPVKLSEAKECPEDDEEKSE